MALPALPPVDSIESAFLSICTYIMYNMGYELAAFPPVVDAGAFPPVDAGALDAGLGGMVYITYEGCRETY